MDPIRHMSAEDLIILKGLAEGRRLNDIAGDLHITQPAVSGRMRKLTTLFGRPLFSRSGRNVQLTEAGLGLASRAGLALDVLRGPAKHNDFKDVSRQVINIGSRPEAAMSWLGPAALLLRERVPAICYHLRVSSGAQILKELQDGELDAVLTSAPVMIDEFDAIEIAREDYVFAATPSNAARIKKIGDLSAETLIEHDRSFPFQRYLDPKIRAKLKFKDVWFLGSTRLMCLAATAGLGIALLPEYVARNDLSQGRLVNLNIDLELMHDHFRLIYRRRPLLRDALIPIANELSGRGLTDRNNSVYY